MIQKEANQPSSDAWELLPEENNDRANLQAALDEVTALKLDLFKKGFSNELLLTRINFLQNELNKYKQQTFSKPQAQEEYILSYNTKENYVDLLHEKFKQMEEQLGSSEFGQKMQEQERLRQKSQALSDQNKRLRKLYLILKEKNKVLQGDSDKFHQIIEDARKMRKLLDFYYRTGQMNQALMIDLKLEEYHPILSDESL